VYNDAVFFFSSFTYYSLFLTWSTVHFETNCIRMYWTDLHQLFRSGRHIGADGQSDHSSIAEVKGHYMTTTFGAKSAKFVHATFIHHTGIPERIGASQHQFQKIKWR